MWATDKIQILQKLSACVQNRSKDFAILEQSTCHWLSVLWISVSFGLAAWFLRLTRLQSVPMNTYLTKCLNCDHISEPSWYKSCSPNLPPSCQEVDDLCLARCTSKAPTHLHRGRLAACPLPHEMKKKATKHQGLR